MNKEGAKKHLEVIKAFAEGKQIQYSHCGSGPWLDISSPVFWPEHEYRVKPEPFETELWVWPDGKTAQVYASDRMTTLAGARRLKVREVI